MGTGQLDKIGGKKIVFIRSEPVHGGDRGMVNKQYEGFIIDKFRVLEKTVDGFMVVDKYLVELDNGILAPFYPEEAKRVLSP